MHWPGIIEEMLDMIEASGWKRKESIYLMRDSVSKADRKQNDMRILKLD